MTRFIGVEHVRRIVTATGLTQFYRLLAGYLEADFRRWPEFAKRERIGAYSPGGVIELMPIADAALYGFKYVNGHPGNPGRNLPTVTAFGALAQMDTGIPVLLSEMTLATALRTAATSALATKYLARPDSSTMALIGLGAQAEFQATAFNAILGIRQVRAFDIDIRAISKFVRNLSGTDIEIVPCANAAEAASGADILTTATADKTRAILLGSDMVAPGAHINAIGGDCPGKSEIDEDLLLRSRIVVEYELQTRIEGEIQYLALDHPVTELWEIIVGKEPGRTDAAQITLFDSVGFALEDFSVLRLLNDLSAETSIGDKIDLIAHPEEPKNLFQLLLNDAA